MPSTSSTTYLLALLCCIPPAVCDDPTPFFEAAFASAEQLSLQLACKDENEACPSWAKAGECKNNPGFMHASCRKACDRCDLSGEDREHALEIAAYAARNLHTGCSAANPPTPFCDGSADRLAAVLAVTQERTGATGGTALQRFLEAIALEITASSRKAAAGSFSPAVPTATTRAASVGGPAASAGQFIELSDGGRMPSVGLGTWLTVGEACYELVRSGLRSGLRHIDTSENYQNHDEIGRALEDSGVPRSEIFLADKLSFAQSYSAAGVRKSVSNALSKMRTECAARSLPRRPPPPRPPSPPAPPSSAQVH